MVETGESCAAARRKVIEELQAAVSKAAPGEPERFAVS
jgi:hypothetical protein